MYETTRKTFHQVISWLIFWCFFHITRPRHAGLWLELEGLGCIGINPLLNSEAKRDQMTTHSCDGHTWCNLDKWCNSAAIICCFPSGEIDCQTCLCSLYISIFGIFSPLNSIYANGKFEGLWRRNGCKCLGCAATRGTPKHVGSFKSSGELSKLWQINVLFHQRQVPQIDCKRKVYWRPKPRSMEKGS